MKKIKKDVFNIAKRIKNIDKNYYILFNYKLQKYEVHFKNSHPSFVCNVPNNSLNFLTLLHVLKTRNISETIKEIEANNLKIENENKRKITEEKEYKLNQIYKFANSGSKDFNCGFNNVWL